MDVPPETVLKSPFLPGLLGAIVSLKTAPGANWKERVFNVLCGTLMAGFLTPAITDYFHLAEPSIQSATAFAIGLFGLNVAAALVLAIKAYDFGALVPRPKKGD